MLHVPLCSSFAYLLSFRPLSLNGELAMLYEVDDKSSYGSIEYIGAHLAGKHLDFYLLLAHQLGQILHQRIVILQPWLVLRPDNSTSCHFPRLAEYLDELQVKCNVHALCLCRMKTPVFVSMCVVHINMCKSILYVCQS